MVNFLQAKNLLLINKSYWHILSVVFMSGFILTTLFFGQFFWLYLLTLIICLISILMSPKSGLYTILICTMWFERHFTLQEMVWGESTFKIYPLDFIIFFTILAIIIKALAKKEWVKFKKFDIFILLFGFLCSFGLVLAMLKHAHFEFAFSTYKNYFLYSVVYFIAYWLLRTKKDWQEFMIWLMVGGFGLFFFLFYGILNGSGLWSEYTPLSTSGSRLIAGTHVFYLLIFGFWVFSGWLFNQPMIKKIGVNFDLLVLFLVIIGLLVSLVRHLWLAVFIIAILWVLFSLRKERAMLWSILKKVFVAGAMAFLVFVWGYILVVGTVPRTLEKVKYIIVSRASVANVISLQDDSFRWRVYAWLSGLELWSSSPVTGVGLGQLLIVEEEDAIYEVPMRDLHNNYFGILIQLGLVGAVFVFSWFIYILSCLKKTWKKVRDQRNFDARFVFTWGSVILLFMIVFSVSVYWDINLFIIWWWLSLAALRFSYYENTSN